MIINFHMSNLYMVCCHGYVLLGNTWIHVKMAVCICRTI